MPRSASRRSLSTFPLLLLSAVLAVGSTPLAVAAPALERPAQQPTQRAGVPADALQVSRVTGSGTATPAGTRVTTTFTVKNRTTKPVRASKAWLFLVAKDGARTFGVGDGPVPRLAPGEDRRVTLTRGPNTKAVGGQYKIRVCLSPRPDGDCRTSRTAPVRIAPPRLVPTPGSVDFAATEAGTSSEESRRVLVRNEGQSVTGRLTVALSGEDAEAFDVIGTSCAASLAPRGSCTVDLGFAPDTAGAKTASLDVTGAQPGAGTEVALTGTALVPPTLAISPGAHDFADTLTGEQSATRDFTVTNTGDVTTGVPAATLTGPDADSFTIVSDTCDAALAPQATCTVDTRFDPAEGDRGENTAVLEVSAARGGTVGADLSGLALAPARLVADDVAFPDTVVGQRSAARDVVVRNTGDVTTGTIAIGVDGASGDFDGVSQGCVTLAPQESCVVSFAFEPQERGQRTLDLVISADPGGSVPVTLSGLGLAPATLAITPARALYDDTVVGTSSATQDLTVTNTGDVPTGTLDVALSGPDADQYEITGEDCDTLAPQATCTVTARFAPTERGSTTADLTVTGAPGGTATSTLAGLALAPAALTITPDEQAYADTELGQSDTQDLVVTNTGDVATGTLDVALTGPDTDQYDVTADDCDTLGPEATCTVTVAFTPTSRGDKAATLTVSAQPGGTASTDLTGLALAPARLVADDLTFPTTEVGQRSAERDLVIRNTGDVATGLLSFDIGAGPSADFPGQRSDCTFVPAQGSCTVTFVFAPSARGERSLELSIVGDPGGTVPVTLSGLALAPAALTIDPASYDFDDTLLDQQSAPQVFTVTNTGDVATGALGVRAFGADAGQFRVTDEDCDTLAPGASCTVTADFRPTTRGAKTADLTVGVTSPGTPGGTVVSTLTGTGLAPARLVMDPAIAGYADTLVGSTSASRRFVVTNVGDVAVGPVTTFVPNGNQFPVTGTTCTGATLAPGGTCTLDVAFAPTSSGEKNGPATVQLVDQPADQPGTVARSSLSGRGVANAALSMSPASFTYPDTILGRSVDQTFTVTNTGDTPTGNIISLGASTPDFPRVGGTCAVGSQLAGGQQCTLVIRFSPTSRGTKRSTVILFAEPGRSGAANLGARTDLTGTGRTPATLVAAPTSHAFADTPVGQPATTRLISVTNTGDVTTGPVTLTLTGDVDQFSVNTAFTMSCSPGTALAPASGSNPASTCRFIVGFTPTTRGAHSATVTVTGLEGGTVSVPLTGTGLAPAALAISPAPYDFGSTGVGARSAPQDFTVTNTGDRPTGTIFTGLDDGQEQSDFEVADSTCSASLPAQGTCRITIVHAPTALGSNDAELSVAAIDAPRAATTLTGTGIPVAVLSIDPTSVAFPTAFLGEQQFRFVDVTNTGAAPSSVLTPTLTGDTAEFFIGSGQCRTALAPGGTCRLTVYFQPTTRGDHSATVTVAGASGAPRESVSSQLTGTGQAQASLAISPGSYQFPQLSVGESRTQTFTATNTGDVPSQTITASVAFGEDPITRLPRLTIVDNLCGPSLAPGASCTLGVRFSPTSTRVTNGFLELRETPSGRGYLAPVAAPGAPAPALSISPATFDFGSQQRATDSVARDFTVTNSGGSPSEQLFVDLRKDNGDQTFDFRITGSTCSGRLANGSSCTVSVVYNPQTTVRHTARLTVRESGAGTVVASLGGTGATPPAVSINPTSYDFGQQEFLTGSAPRDFTVTNTGGSPSRQLFVDLLEGTSTSANFDITGSTCTGALAAQSSCTVSVSFGPQNTGGHAARLTVQDGATVSLTSNLSGTGTPPLN